MLDPIHFFMLSWFLFFFSSRRRHTRLQGDWSSDVCSSDLDERLARFRLGELDVLDGERLPELLEHGGADPHDALRPRAMRYSAGVSSSNQARRSEERRVGKEGRSRR